MKMRAAIFSVFYFFSMSVANAFDVDDAEKSIKNWQLQANVFMGIGNSNFLVGSAVNSSTGEVKNVYLNPGSADGVGIRANRNIFSNIDLAAGVAYHSARENVTVNNAQAEFSWINSHVAFVARTAQYFEILKTPVRAYGGAGLNYISSPKLSISGWASVSGSYASQMGYLAMAGLESRTSDAFGYTFELRYLAGSTVSAKSMSLNGSSTYSVIAPDKTDLHDINLNSVEIVLGMNWSF